MSPADRKVWRDLLQSLRSDSKLDTVIRIEALSETLDHELFVHMGRNSSLTTAVVFLPVIFGATIYNSAGETTTSIWNIAVMFFAAVAFIAAAGARVSSYFSLRRLKEIIEIVDDAVRRGNDAVWDDAK